MAHAIRMPKPGQMTEECTLSMWRKAEGDPVAPGDVLFEIETDKSSMEVEAFDAGVLLKIVQPEGATVPVNAICAWVGAAGEAVPDDDGPAVAVTAEEERPEPAPAPASAPLPAAPPASAPAAPVPAAPSAAPVAVASVPIAVAAAGSTGAASGPRLRISPRASRAAAEAGIDPRSIAGTGPDGRIVERDVAAAVAVRATSPVTATAPAPVRPAPAPALAMPPIEGEEEPRPLSRMRRVIAERLTQSWTTIPHFTVTVAVDVTRILALRQELKASGVNLTVTDFVLSATAQTLAEFPDVNSRTDGVQVWPRRRVHLGVAVAVPNGLVVPVIRDADRLPISRLHDEAASLAERARAGSISPDELTGSTFTVSNLGMLGVEEFSAIINPGEAAILAVASAVPTVVALGDAMTVRQVMKLTLSADHRLVDGELAARFLGALRRRLEDVRAFEWEARLG